MLLHPKGHGKLGKDHVSLYLENIDVKEENLNNVSVKYVLSIRNHDDYSCCSAKQQDFTNFNKNSNIWGFPQFIKSNDLFNKNEKTDKPLIENNKTIIGAYIRVYKFSKEQYINELKKLMKAHNPNSDELMNECFYEWEVKGWDQIKKNECSPEFTIGDQKWQICMEPNGPPGKNGKDFLSLYLDKEGIIDDDPIIKRYIWASIVLSIRNPKDYSHFNALATGSETRYINDQLKCGFPEFIKKVDLTSKNNSLIEDNKFIVSTLIRVYSTKGWNKLHFACMNGDVDEVERLLESKPRDISSKTEDGWTPLHIAVYSNKIEIVKSLLDHGADKDVINDGYSPVYIASKNGYTDIVQLLEEYGANINVLVHGWSPIQSACSNNHFDTVEYLLCKGANINLRTDHEYILLHIATEANNMKLVELLLNKGNMDINAKDSGGWTALHIASRNNYHDLAKYIIKFGHADVDETDKNLNTPLHIASQYGNYDITQLLINNKAKINFNNRKGWTPLHIACQNSHTEVVKYLLENHANVDSITNDGKTALHISCANDNRNIIQLLLDNKADINRTTFEGWTALHIAIYYNNPAIVQYLLKRKPDLNERTNEGLTVFDMARLVNNKEIIQMLKEHVLKIDESEKKALIIFLKNNSNNSDIQKGYIEGSTKTGTENEEESIKSKIITKSEMLINEIKMENNNEAINIIESREIGLEYIDVNGWTALHWACYLNNLEIAQLLIDNNVELEKRTRNGINNSDEFKGKTAKEIAEIRGYTEIVNIINKKSFWSKVNKTLNVISAIADKVPWP